MLEDVDYTRIIELSSLTLEAKLHSIDGNTVLNIVHQAPNKYLDSLYESDDIFFGSLRINEIDYVKNYGRFMDEYAYELSGRTRLINYAMDIEQIVGIREFTFSLTEFIRQHAKIAMRIRRGEECPEREEFHGILLCAFHGKGILIDIYVIPSSDLEVFCLRVTFSFYRGWESDEIDALKNRFPDFIEYADIINTTIKIDELTRFIVDLYAMIGKMNIHNNIVKKNMK